MKTSRRTFLGVGGTLFLAACRTCPTVEPRLHVKLRGLRPANVSIQHQKMWVDFELVNRSAIDLSLARISYEVSLDTQLWVTADLGGFIVTPLNSRKLIRDVHTLTLAHWGRVVGARAQNSSIRLTGSDTLADSSGRWKLTDIVKARQINLSSTNDADAGL